MRLCSRINGVARIKIKIGYKYCFKFLISNVYKLKFLLATVNTIASSGFRQHLFSLQSHVFVFNLHGIFLQKNRIGKTGALRYKIFSS
jgi:hypothetical protein